MDNDKIDVYNYLDEHAVIHNRVVEGFSIKKLQKAFPEIDEFTIKAFEAEWRAVRYSVYFIKKIERSETILRNSAVQDSIFDIRFSYTLTC